MTFIITLISLIIERFFHWTHLRHWRWFAKYQQWLSYRSGKWPTYLTLLACILPLLIVVGLINLLLAGWLYGIIKLLFGIAVLVYCFGPNNLWLDVYSCINALNKTEPHAAIEHAQTCFGIATPENSQKFHLVLTRAIFVKAYRRVFAVAFWFVILGPVGAVLYRSLTLCTKDSPLGVSQAAKQTQNVLDWIPVRIFTFLFALGGHFVDVFNVWKHSFKQGLNANETLLGDCGVAALDVMEKNQIPEEGSAEKEALSLLDRVFVMSLVVLAIIILLTKPF